MDSTVRLRIATRIHFALLRHYGEDVGVSTLLRGGQAAREALWVCQASEHPELAALGRELSDLLAAEAAERAQALSRADARSKPAAGPQDAPWARDTSGFGVTRPGVDLPEPDHPGGTPAGWFGAGRWLRRGLRAAR